VYVEEGGAEVEYFEFGLFFFVEVPGVIAAGDDFEYLFEDGVMDEFAGVFGVGLEEEDVEFVEGFAVGAGVVLDLFLDVVFQQFLCVVGEVPFLRVLANQMYSS
jgi:hypothetical protein